MDWFKKERWKAGIALAGLLLLMVLMMWIPVSGVGAHEITSGLATPVTGTVQATPTADATRIALEKEKLQHDVNQQQHTPGNWFWNNGAALVSSLLLPIAGIFTVFRYLRDQRNEQEKQSKDHQTELEKRAEERFQKVVEGLGSDKEEAKVGAAIMLRTFLSLDYKQFHKQAFDLAVAHLRLPRTSGSSEDPDGILNSPEYPKAALELNSLSQALITVFTRAFPLVRNELIQDEQRKGGKEKQFDPQSLNATHINLDHALLWGEHLEQVWLAWAYLREADLSGAHLPGAWLWRSNLRGARLVEADLRRADLGQGNLHEVDLHKAQLQGAMLWGADLSSANLSGANLGPAKPDDAQVFPSHRRDKLEATLLLANLHRADIRGADLSGADLSGADLSGATLLGLRISGIDRLRRASQTYTEVDVSQVKLTVVAIGEVELTKATRSDYPWEALRCWANSIQSGAYGGELLLADLTGVRKLEEAKSLTGTNLRGVEGLGKEQRDACKARGAIIDEDTTASPPQSPVSPAPSSQSNS